ncbi:MAG: MBL fold metallo-hydrolase [Akkermansiaceae bacterium]|nr:MBL fold metallo-hydrolase [Akkermansiaceae bacterium]
MKISTYTGGMVQTNGYLVETTEGNFLVDAPAGITSWLDEKGIRVDALYLTHQHYDHVEDVAVLRGKGVKVYAWAPYSKDLTLESYGSSWGLPEVADFQVDELIVEGDGKMFGTAVKVGHVPGHSADSLTFCVPAAGIVFAGDALFAGSVGRCDLPGGDFELLLSGVRRELLTLPDETKVLSGHGEATTVGREKVSNGYLK